MSHTTEIGDWAFIHNGDYSGDVRVVAPGRPGECGPRPSIEVPGAVLFAFLARAVRNMKVAKMENTSDAEALGIDPVLMPR